MTFKITRRNGSVHEVLVDDADYERVAADGPWHVKPHRRTFYVQRNVRRDGKQTSEYLHTFITNVIGIDHVNRNALDNRRANLRPATTAENMQNQGANRPATSGIRGARRAGRRWQARVGLNGREHYLGSFATAEEAGAAAKAARMKLFTFNVADREETGEHP